MRQIIENMNKENATAAGAAMASAEIIRDVARRLSLSEKGVEAVVGLLDMVPQCRS